MTERTELIVPARPEYLYLARLQVAAIAARIDMTVADAEDVHLAVEELCMSFLQLSGQAPHHLSVAIEWSESTIEVRCSIEDADDSAGATSADDSVCFPASLSKRLLDALVDDHGITTDRGHPVAWLRKSRTSHTSGS